MRLSAYKKALKQVNELPDSIEELDSYFSDSYSPRAYAVHHVLKRAREDTKALFLSELVELHTYSRTLE